MIRGLVLDGYHEGHLVNLSGPIPTLKMTKPINLEWRSMVEEALSDRIMPHHAEYKMVYRPTDGGNIFLYAENNSESVFFRIGRDWVEKDKYWRYNRKKNPIIYEGNNPYEKELQQRVEAIKETIKKNVVPKNDFDLDGHLWYLTHASKA